MEIIDSQLFNYKQSWIFEISWNNNNKKEKFIGCGKSKKDATNLVLHLAEESILKLL